MKISELLPLKVYPSALKKIIIQIAEEGSVPILLMQLILRLDYIPAVSILTLFQC